MINLPYELTFISKLAATILVHTGKGCEVPILCGNCSHKRLSQKKKKKLNLLETV